MIDFFKTLFVVTALLWTLFMTVGTVILFTHMMYITLCDIFKGEW